MLCYERILNNLTIGYKLKSSEVYAGLVEHWPRHVRFWAFWCTHSSDNCEARTGLSRFFDTDDDVSSEQ